MKVDRKQHWETVYKTKTSNEVSWTQEKPATSLNFIRSINLDKNAEIIDVGGGDSKLVDFLLDEGYTNITVLDISKKALEKAQNRLGEKASKVTWIVSDITQFQPKTTYDLWHDRATFHFLTTAEELANYTEITNKYVAKYLFIGTFSTKGPKKCSGLEISQYDENKLSSVFNRFKKLNCKTEDHQTPFNTIQNFQFCSFEKE